MRANKLSHYKIFQMTLDMTLYSTLCVLNHLFIFKSNILLFSFQLRVHVYLFKSH